MCELINWFASQWTSGGSKNAVVPKVLDFDVTYKDLHYYSMAKVRDFGLNESSGGYGGGIGGAGFSVNASKAAAPKGNRELLTLVGRYLQSCGLLVYEDPSTAVPGSSYILARVLGRYGNLWTFHTAEDDPIRDVIWFKGQGTRVRVLAYGSRQNLAREGDVPEKSNYKASWWPSGYGAHKGIVERLVDRAINEDQRNAIEDEELVGDVDAFVRYCFNDGVLRGQTYTHGLYEILLRVDRVANFDTQLPWVVGSPIWFAKCSPGIYLIPSLAVNNDQCCEVYGVWDGGTWANIFYGPENNKLRYMLPDLPFLVGDSNVRADRWTSWCKEHWFGDCSNLRH
mgnify:CR=1 FL=1